MVNFWEETAVDQMDNGGAAAAPVGPMILGYQGLGEIIGRIKAGRATKEERAPVLVLAEEIEAEVSELGLLAAHLRTLAAGG